MGGNIYFAFWVGRFVTGMWGVGGVWEIGDFRENAQKWSFFRARCRSMGAFFRKKLPIYILFKYPPPPPPIPTHPPPTPHIPVTNPHPTPEINKYSHTAIIISRIIINKYILFLFNKILFIYPHAHRYTPGSAPRLIPKNKSRAPSSP